MEVTSLTKRTPSVRIRPRLPSKGSSSSGRITPWHGVGGSSNLSESIGTWCSGCAMGRRPVEAGSIPAVPTKGSVTKWYGIHLICGQSQVRVLPLPSGSCNDPSASKERSQTMRRLTMWSVRQKREDHKTSPQQARESKHGSALLLALPSENPSPAPAQARAGRPQGAVHEPLPDLERGHSNILPLELFAKGRWPSGKGSGLIRPGTRKAATRGFNSLSSHQWTCGSARSGTGLLSQLSGGSNPPRSIREILIYFPTLLLSEHDVGIPAEAR